jgi:hypothetical protein
MTMTDLLLNGEEWQCRRWVLGDARSAEQAERHLDDLLARRAESGRYLDGRVGPDALCLSALDGLVAAGRMCLRAEEPSLCAAGVRW